MSKWIAEFELEDGDTMPEHMDLTYNGAKLDFHCKPLNEVEAEDCISRSCVYTLLKDIKSDVDDGYGFQYEEWVDEVKDLPTVYPKSEIDEDIYKASLNLQATALNNLWNTNKQLKKELEMLKLDRECDKPSGKWIIDDKESYRIWHCHCSNCGKDPQDYIGGTENWWLVRLPNYCPNCGSKNVVEEQGENTNE